MYRSCSNDTKGLRLDLAIAIALGLLAPNDRELWFDHGNTHSTQTSMIMLDRTTRFAQELYEAENSHGGSINAKKTPAKSKLSHHRQDRHDDEEWRS
jgi:hypothetical protein